jgi:hypothetical protein
VTCDFDDFPRPPPHHRMADDSRITHHFLDAQHAAKTSRSLATVRSGSRSIQTTIMRRKGRLSSMTAKPRVIGPAVSSNITSDSNPPNTRLGSLRAFHSSSSPPPGTNIFSDDLGSDSFDSPTVADMDTNECRQSDPSEAALATVPVKRTRVRVSNIYFENEF